jgi:hypothetical protein
MVKSHHVPARAGERVVRVLRPRSVRFDRGITRWFAATSTDPHHVHLPPYVPCRRSSVRVHGPASARGSSTSTGLFTAIYSVACAAACYAYVRVTYELALASPGAHGAREYVHRTTPSGAASSRRRHGAVLAAAGTEDRAL